MQINADFFRRVAVHAADLPWVPSPVAGIDRRMLDRVGAEVARATSIVRYAPDSRFTEHVHGGGEEFLVLDGVFSDEQGDYPPGSYLRNPPTSRHAPGSRGGCTIFVKLWQFDPLDRVGIRLDSSVLPIERMPGRPDVEMSVLFQNDKEQVRIEHWAAGATVTLSAAGGIEILVLAGTFEESAEQFRSQSWLRLPADMPLHAVAGPEGCRVWIKTGHLAHIRVPD